MDTPVKRGPGRPKGPVIGFTQTQGNRICESIANGMTLRQVAKKEGISDSRIIRVALQDEKFNKRYRAAMDIRTELDFERLTEMSFEKPAAGQKYDSTYVNHLRVIVDTYKWVLARRAPKKYGDRIDSEITGEIAIKRVVADI